MHNSIFYLPPYTFALSWFCMSSSSGPHPQLDSLSSALTITFFNYIPSLHLQYIFLFVLQIIKNANTFLI